MIELSPKVFRQICESRGASWADCQKAISASRDDVLLVDETSPYWPVRPTINPGLGDMVASALSAVGITKERVSKALGKPCGCAKRQEKLNELGRKFGIG